MSVMPNTKTNELFGLTPNHCRPNRPKRHPARVASEITSEIIPSVRVPVQPLLLKGFFSVYSMFKDFDPKDFHWVLPIY